MYGNTGMGQRNGSSPNHQNQYGNNQSSSGGQSQHSSGFNQIRIHSEVLELIQALSLDYDQLSPVEVRQSLRQLISAEQEARSRRESYLSEILQQRIQDEQARYKENFDQCKISFELETIKFEKVLKDRAQGVIKSLQIRQLDRLIDFVGRVRQIHNLHGNDFIQEKCRQTQHELSNLIQHVDNLMAELSGEDANSCALSEQFNFASQEELQRKLGNTPFTDTFKDQVLFLQQQSSNGVVAINRHNQVVVMSNQRGISHNGLGDGNFGAATSYGGVTSGEGLPITSGSNILNPNTTPSQDFQNPADATLSNPQIQNMHRSNTTNNQLVKPGANGRPRFVYDLPKDFPFNEACIEKSISNDLAHNGAMNCGSNGLGTNSQQTESNHDVNPDDVLRTFTNSLHSGGTLGAIHSSLTYYKEALASKEWSNLSPSNAYQNFMWKKNLVGEIQKLAKEISRIPTEEAKILADLSKSHLSHEGSRRHIQYSNQLFSGFAPQNIPAGMTTAEAISKGFGFIGNNESSILMDLNRASIVAAQKEAEELKQKAKRIVDDSATRLEPVVKSFTDAPINQQLLQSQNRGQQNFNYGLIQYQPQPNSSIPDSQGFFPGRDSTAYQSSQMMMYDNANNESIIRDSCVMYEDQPKGTNAKQHANQDSVQKQSPAKNPYPLLNYHASNERSQLSEDEEPIFDEVQQQSNKKASAQAALIPPKNRILSGHKRHGSVVVGEQTIGEQILLPQKKDGASKKTGRELINIYAERRSIQHERDELSPKQLRNESLSVQRSSIAAKRQVQRMGFFSNDQAVQFTDMELEQIEKAQNFQQTASFAPKNQKPWWLEDAQDLNQNQVIFQQTAGPSMQARNMLAAKLKSSRRRGTQSVNSQYPNFASQNIGSANISGNTLKNTRFGDQNLSNNALDNKGRAIKMNGNHEQASGNLYDELSRVAEYQSSRSVLDGQSSKALRNQQSNLNRTMQIKKKTANQGQGINNNNNDGARELISRSVLTNLDRASPIPSSGETVGTRVAKMNIKKNQIKLVERKRDSIQAGSTSTGHQSKSVSREGRIKVKLVQKAQKPDEGVAATDPNISRFSSVQNGGISINASQSPKMSRNGATKIVLATGPSKSTQGQNIPTGVIDNQRQRELSPQHQYSHLAGLQQPSQASYNNKIPFKTNRREDNSGPQVRNNFFSEESNDLNNPQMQLPLEQENVDKVQQRLLANVSQLSAPISSQPPLKIRRNRKQSKRMTPTIQDSQRNSFDEKPGESKQIDSSEAENHFNEIAKNLRSVSQQQQNSNNVFIRKGSHHQQNLQQNTKNPSVANSQTHYGGGIIQQSRDNSAGESLNSGSNAVGFVRTYKAQKSRQAEDLDRPFVTERVCFHKSALMSNNQTNRKANVTQDEQVNQTTPGFKRHANPVNANANSVTVRVQSHSQPPFDSRAKEAQQYLEGQSIIPPPTEDLTSYEQINEATANPGHFSGSAQVSVNIKHPVVKMTAINFIGPSSSQQTPTISTVSNFNSGQVVNSSNQFSFHHPHQQPSQGKFPSHGKKPSITAQLETSPYMTQQKIVAPSQQAANKRVIHLKRPSTNLQMAQNNQPSLVGKNAFGQRAASRVEQTDKQNELQFQAGATIGTSTVFQRPSAQIRIGKKMSTAANQHPQAVIGASRTSGNFIRPPSDNSNEGEYSYH